MTHASNFARNFAKDNALHRKLVEPELELAIMRSQRSLVLEAAAQANCQEARCGCVQVVLEAVLFNVALAVSS